jgi:hypothetical protein
MSKVALSGNALGTGTFTVASPNSNTDRTLTLPDVTGTLITNTAGTVTQTMLASNVAGNGPAFSAYSSTGTSVTNNTYTKLLLQTEDFDTNSNYDTSNSRFTPTVAGYYQFNWACGTPVQAEKASALYKNGVVAKIGSNVIGFILQGSAVIYMNGSTDYVEVYVFQSTGSTQTSYTGTNSGFSGALIRSAT